MTEPVLHPAFHRNTLTPAEAAAMTPAELRRRRRRGIDTARHQRRTIKAHRANVKMASALDAMADAARKASRSLQVR
jgi:hypothetical protein